MMQIAHRSAFTYVETAFEKPGRRNGHGGSVAVHWEHVPGHGVRRARESSEIPIAHPDACKERVLEDALELHRAGRLDEAMGLYQRILASEPDNALALHSYGVLCQQRGEPEAAVTFIARSVALAPNAIDWHVNLAEAYRACGRFDRAIGTCRVALVLNPDHPAALCNLGAALQGLNRHAEATQHLRRALELAPDLAIAHSNLGVALHALGQPEESLEHFRQAVELQPHCVSGLVNLAQALLDRGRSGEALPYCEAALRLQPDVPVLHQHLGNILLALERHRDARAAYLDSLRLAPEAPQCYAHIGLSLQTEGRPCDALPWIKQAADSDPGSPAFSQRLAELYDELEDPEESIACWRRLMTLMEDSAAPRIGLGRALLAQGAPAAVAEAREQFHIALKIDPDAAPAHMGLASLQEQLGETAGAEASLRAALRAQPDSALPLARLATMLRGKLPSEDREALERRLSDPDLGPHPRARLLFGFAHALDAGGEFKRAADCLRNANALVRSLKGGNREYSSDEHKQLVDALLKHTTRDFFERLNGAGSDSRRPVFVFGLPRSGTTLTEQILASHSQIHGAGELKLARQSFDSLPRILKRSEAPRECLPFLDATGLRCLANQHLDALAAIAGGHHPRVVDKMPDNYLHVGLLAALFPHAVLVHCRRDLRDTALSCWMTDFAKIPWANDVHNIADRFGHYRRLMTHWHAVLGTRIIDVDYEQTVTDLEGVARHIIAACNLEWEPACLEFHRTERPIRTASLTQVRQPLYQHSVGRWRNYAETLGDLFAALPPSPEVA